MFTVRQMECRDGDETQKESLSSRYTPLLQANHLFIYFNPITIFIEIYVCKITKTQNRIKFVKTLPTNRSSLIDALSNALHTLMVFSDLVFKQTEGFTLSLCKGVN